MANIRKHEIERLKTISDTIAYTFPEESAALACIIERLECANYAANMTTRKIISERRLLDPLYGRSAAERERIAKKLGMVLDLGGSGDE